MKKKTNVMDNVIWVLRSIFRFDHNFIFVMGVATVITGICSPMSTLISQSLMNSLQERKSLQMLLTLAAIYIGIDLFQMLIGYFLDYYKYRFAQEYNLHLNQEVLQKLSRLNLKSFESSETYDMVSRAQYEADGKLLAYFDFLTGVFSSIITTVSYLLIIVRFRIWIMLCILIIPVVKFCINRKMNLETFKAIRERTNDSRKCWYMQHVLTYGEAYKELKIYNLFSHFISRYREYKNLIAKYYDSHISLYYEKQTAPILYDTIYGLSGLLNYYLDNRKDQKCTIEGLMKYLISLTGKNMSGIINYFIMELPSYAIKESESVPYLDFGMAHGILGPLIVMSKAKNQGFYTDGIEEAIQILFNLYKDYTVQAENKILKFPVQLGVKEYKEKTAKRLSFNCGWCYGNGSIALGLMRSAQYCGNSDEYEYYKEALLKILSDPIEQQGLDEPIICHGYASVLMLQMSAYFQTNDIRFLETLDKNVYITLKCHGKYWDKTEYRTEYSILEGANGVMLALLKTMGGKIASNRLLLLE